METALLQLLLRLVVMSHPFLHSRTSARTYPSGAWLIAIGLAILISAAGLPIAPVVTAMAIIALGATNATLARFQGSLALRPVLLLHAVTYLTLYALLIGATLHAATAASTVGLGLGRSLDLAVSILPMAVALQRMGGMLSRRGG